MEYVDFAASPPPPPSPLRKYDLAARLLGYSEMGSFVPLDATVQAAWVWRSGTLLTIAAVWDDPPQAQLWNENASRWWRDDGSRMARYTLRIATAASMRSLLREMHAAFGRMPFANSLVTELVEIGGPLSGAELIDRLNLVPGANAYTVGFAADGSRWIVNEDEGLVYSCAEWQAIGEAYPIEQVEADLDQWMADDLRRN
jgi:hypothetical protein